MNGLFLLCLLPQVLSGGVNRLVFPKSNQAHPKAQRFLEARIIFQNIAINTPGGRGGVLLITLRGRLF